MPRFARLLPYDVVVMAVQCHVVLLHIRKEFIRAKHFRNLNELVVVVLALEERFLLENHARKHAAKRPDVQRVVINLQINQELGAFEVATGNTNVVLLTRVVELS
jgi:hypothetical protein